MPIDHTNGIHEDLFLKLHVNLKQETKKEYQMKPRKETMKKNREKTCNLFWVFVNCVAFKEALSIFSFKISKIFLSLFS